MPWQLLYFSCIASSVKFLYNVRVIEILCYGRTSSAINQITISWIRGHRWTRVHGVGNPKCYSLILVVLTVHTTGAKNNINASAGKILQSSLIAWQSPHQNHDVAAHSLTEVRNCYRMPT